MAKHHRTHADEPDTKKVRKARRRRRFFLRLLLFAVVIAVGALLVKNWEALKPDTLIAKINGLLTGNSEDGFPMDVSGNQILQMETAGGYTVLVSDTYVTMVNGSGAEVMRRAHAFSDPQLRTAGKYVLLAECGGKRLQLETVAKTVLSLSTDYDILTTAVHKNGNIAVVTASEQGYNASVTVYSAGGERLYHRQSSSLIADVAFSPNGDELALITVEAAGGSLSSAVKVVSIHSEDSAPLYTHSESNTLLCRLQYLSDSLIAAVGDTTVWMYRPKRDTCQIYRPADGEMQAFAIGEDSVVTVTAPYGSTAGGNVTYIGTDGSAAFTASVEGTVRDIAVSGNSYALLTSTQLYQVTGKGIVGSRTMTADGSRVAVSGSRVLVLGLQNLTQYTAPSRLNETE